MLAAPQPPAKADLEAVLDRAGWYLDYFVDEFENVVAEENYIQDSSQLLPTISPAGGGRGAIAPPPSAAEMLRARHRDLRSDFLLVKSPDTQALVPFRDVIQVDGIMVRDREARLAKLFLTESADAMGRAERIREEGARYNLGNMRSTLGNPVLALGVLQQTYQARFRFSLAKEDRSFGPGVTVVDYKEVGSPAMIHGEAGRDLPAHGRLWIDSATGRVLKTELQVEQPAVRAIITTTFQAEEKSGIAVPLEMREQYTFPNGNRVNTVANYGRFRRFDVSASEDIRTPIATTADAWTGMAFVELPPGRFTMGSASLEAGRNDDEMLHDVEITRPFLMGQNEVTQQEWRTVMGNAPEPLHRLRAALPGGERHLRRRAEVPREAERASAADAALPPADRGGMGVRVPRADDRAVLDRREPDDRAGELQRAPAVRIVSRRRVPAEDDADRHVPAQPVGARRHARQRVGMDVGLVRPVRRERLGEHRSARRRVRREARDPRRQLVLRRQQRAVRAALHPRAAGQGLQPRLPGGGGSSALIDAVSGTTNAYCS